MKHLLLIAMTATLAMAKPGLYKEKEDFQYSRSSTDEGNKSGYYGAQRGNMGGNYERAHNMDGLAQHQMGGLVRQVDGELGDGSKTRTGSVYTAANSRGLYGSGHYDLSNLEGRNFQDGLSYEDAQSQLQSHSSMASQSGYNSQAQGYNLQSGYNSQSSGYDAQSSALNNAAYHSRNSHDSKLQNGYSGYQYLGSNGVDSNLQQQQTENLQSTNQYGYGSQQAADYYSQSAHNGQSASNLHNANSYGSNSQTRFVSGMPVKVILRPGTRVAAPTATQTYDSSNSAAYNHNSVNSDTELLSNQNQQHISYKPTGAKHYESSYSYRKEWEKHDTQPVTALPVDVPTTNPFPKNSELYEDAQSLSAGQQYASTGAGYQRAHSHSSNSYGGYNANVNSASLTQTQQSAYNAQQQRSASTADSDLAASSQGIHNSGAGADTTNQIEDLNNKPKSYQSSYSYHKSWERQGDPYVIKPAGSGYDTLTSQRLTAGTSNQKAWSSHQYGSRYQQAHQNLLNQEDCNGAEDTHTRVARSYDLNQYEEQNPYQQRQYNHDQEALSQQSQNHEDLTQQTQNKWDRIEDLGQQTQNQWDRIEDLGQQQQNKWDKIEDLGQQAQNQWDRSEDLVQQTQNKWDQSEDLVQQTQNKWDQSEDLVQQTQNKWDQSEGLVQQSQNKWDQLEDLGQQTQNKWDQSEGLVQQSQNKWDQLEDLGQQTQTNFDKLDVGQQTQSKWDHFDGQQSQLDHGQELQNTWTQSETSGFHGVGQETQTNWNNLNIPPQDVIGESVTSSNKPTQQPLETESHKLPTGINVIPSRAQNENNKPSIPNIFNSYGKPTFPKELPTESSMMKNQDSTEKTPAYNNFNHPWFNEFPNTPQSSEQAQTNNYNNQQSHYNAWNSHWPSIPGSQPHNTWDESFINHYHTSGIRPQNTAQDTSTLWNLWNKIDTIEKQTISSNKNRTEESQNSYNSQTKPTIEEIDNIQNKPLMHQYGHNSGEPQYFYVETSTPTTSSTKHVEPSTLPTTSTTVKNKPQDGLHRSDIGRGDIGPEDIVNDHVPQLHFQEIYKEFETQPKPVISIPTSEHYKSPTETEAPSQVIINDKITANSTKDIRERDSIVNSYEQPKHKLSGVSSTTSRVIIGVSENNLNYENTITVEDEKSTSFNQPKSEPSAINDGQQDKNFELEKVHQQSRPLQTESHKTNHRNLPKEQNEKDKTVHKVQTDEAVITPVETDITKNEIIPGNPLQHPRQTNRDTSVDSNKWEKHNYSNSAMPADNEQNDKFDKQNTDQQFENFGQQSQKFDQQNTEQQFENFGQQSNKFDQQNTEQQFENFGQQSDKFDQQNTDQQFENFGQQSDKFDQQNTDQQFENFEQQSDTFDQQNKDQQFENYGQQSESFGQQRENLGRLNENFEQRNQNIDQSTDHKFGSFYQQVGREPLPIEQKFETLGQQVDNMQEVKFINLPRPKKQENEMMFHNQINLDQQKFEQQDNLNSGSPVEPLHKIQNVETSSTRNVYSTYKEQQSENPNQEDLKQHLQTGWEQNPNSDEKANVQETQNLQVIPVETPVNKLYLPEDRATITQVIENKDVTPISTSMDAPPETDKESPGFWKSVGNKFVSAKDKVFTWFSRS